MAKKYFEYESIKECYLEYDIDPSENIKKLISKETKYYDVNRKKISSDKKILKLNKQNVLQIEKILMIDSSYAYTNFSEDVERLKKSYTYENMRNLCININNVNSTHINSDNKGYWVIPDRIIRLCTSFDKLEKSLRKNAKELITMIYLPIKEQEFCDVRQRIEKHKQQLSEDTLKDFEDICDKYDNKKAKFDRDNHNISFATKFCHYVSNEILDGENRDKYPIYDSIVGKAIPLNINYFLEVNDENKNIKALFEKELSRIIENAKNKKVHCLLRKNRKGLYGKLYFKKYDFNDKTCKVYEEYEQFIDIIDAVRNYAKKRYNDKKCITRLGFDHVLWYGYKGRLK